MRGIKNIEELNIPQRLLVTSPLVIGIIWGLIPALPNVQWVTGVVSTLLGLYLCVVLKSLINFILDVMREYSRLYEKILEAKLGGLPSVEVIKLLVPFKLPPHFTRYLSNERDNQQCGIETLKRDGRWPLSTARLYEVILTSISQSSKIHIIDQDIRRWYEILRSENCSLPNNDFKLITSTTFNYSWSILEHVNKTLISKSTKLKALQRIFIINPEGVSAFTDRDCQLAKKGADWSELNPATQVIVLLWAFEQRMREYRSNNRKNKKHENDLIGTRFIQVGSSDITKKKLQRIHNNKDTVLMDSSFCLQEDLVFEVQGSTLTSEDTQSTLLINEGAIQESERLFDEVWKISKSASDFPEFTLYFRCNEIMSLLAAIDKEQQVNGN